jgi:hypothetical protein
MESDMLDNFEHLIIVNFLQNLYVIGQLNFTCSFFQFWKLIITIWKFIFVI